MEREIFLRTKMENIPDDCVCLCGVKTERAYFEHWLGYSFITVRLHPVAGYRCPIDGIEYMSNESLMESLRAVKTIMQKAGNEAAVAEMQGRITTEEKIIKEGKDAKN